ncbi:MAG: serine hydrolase [Xanthomonadales bacterium]|nr:serine hydrolase [Xanthomonadales bacterium]
MLLGWLGMACVVQAQSLVSTYGIGCCAFGWAVTETPDLDADGRPDFAVGAIGQGRLFAYSASSATPLVNVQLSGSDFGYALSWVPDVDGDGRAELVAGAPNLGAGVVQLVSGANGSVLRQIAAPAGASLFGSAVSGVDDINGDGRGDILVGAPGGAGSAHFFSGADGSLLRSVSAPVANGAFGMGIAAVSDHDGDGRPDAVIGAPRASGGRAYVVSTASGSVLRTFSPQNSGFSFGEFFVADAGDVDGDGRSDVYVGAYSESNGSGAAYVFSGADGSRLLRIAGANAEGLGPGRGAGDVDGDGRADLVIGSYTYSGSGVSQGGRVRVFSGRDGSVLEEVTGSVAGGQLGFDAVGVGDVTGDGRLDFIAAQTGAGSVHLYAGNVDRGNAFVINPGLTGAWSDPAASGQGFLFEVIESQSLIAGGWYTHVAQSPGATQEQRWLTYVGGYDGDLATMTLYLTRGGQFTVGGGITDSEVGTLTIRFIDCLNAVAEYSVFANAISGEGDPVSGAVLTGTIPLRRVTPADQCEALSDFAELSKQFQQVLDDSVAAQGIIGSQASVRVPGYPVWNGVSGTEDDVAPMRPELLIGTGSITKMITVVAALRLVDRGVIDFDDRLVQWFPDQPNLDPGITVRQAMHQVSGIADYMANATLTNQVFADLQRVWTPDELRQFIGPPNFAPGTAWQASNSNSLLLGRIVELETGKSLAEFMREELFGGLQSIWLAGFGEAPSPVSTQWFIDGAGTRLNVNESNFGPSLFTFRREVQASAGDVAAFTERLFRGDLLSAPTRAAMLEIVPDDGGIPGQTGGGLGIRRYNLLGRTLYGHSGGTPNSSAFVLFDPATGIVASVSVNQNGPSHGQSHFQTAPALLQAALDFVGG